MAQAPGPAGAGILQEGWQDFIAQRLVSRA
jgi:hypothetical protein